MPRKFRLMAILRPLSMLLEKRLAKRRHVVTQAAAKQQLKFAFLKKPRGAGE